MDKTMSRKNLFRLLLALSTLPIGHAFAEEIEWGGSTYPFLEGRSTETESDASLRALCAPGHRVILSFGAPASPGFMGEGKGEPFSVTLESAGKSAVAKGVSKPSVDSKLTGGIELAMEITVDDPVFDVLTTGKPVTMVKTDGQKEVLTEGEGSASIKEFVTACGGG